MSRKTRIIVACCSWFAVGYATALFFREKPYVVMEDCKYEWVKKMEPPVRQCLEQTYGKWLKP